MPLTFDQLTALLTPQNGVLTVEGSAFETAAVTRLFALYFAAGTLVVDDCTSAPDGATQTVTVTGTLAPSTFLRLADGVLRLGTFHLAGGEVAVRLDVSVQDGGWTLPDSLPQLENSIFANLTYAQPAFGLDSTAASVLGADFRRSFGYRTSDPAIESAIVPGLSFSASIGFAAPLAYLAELIRPPFAVAGPIEVYPQHNEEPPQLRLMPQLLFDTGEAGQTLRAGDYTFAFQVQLASVLQEFGDRETGYSTIPTGAIAVRTNFDAQGLSPIPVAMFVYENDYGRLLFNVGSPLSMQVNENQLPALLNGASPGNQLHPGYGFPGFDALQLEGVSLAMHVQPVLTLDSIMLVASLGRGKQWVLFDLLTIDAIYFILYSTFSDLAWSVSAEVRGLGYLANNPQEPLFALSTSVNLSSRTLAFHASLQQLAVLDLTQLVRGLIGDAIDMPVIEGSSFAISGDVALNAYSFEASILGEWVIFGTAANGLVLRELGLTLGTEDIGGEQVVTGGVAGELTLAGVPVTLGADYDSEGSWTFSGSSEPEQSLDLVALFGELTQLFGVALPPGLPAILLERLRVEYSMETGVFAVDCALAVPDATYDLADLPLIGRRLDPMDRISLDSITIAIQTGGETPSLIDFGFIVGFGTNDSAGIVIRLGGEEEEGRVSGPPQSYPAKGGGESVPVQRSFGPLLVEKLAFVLDEAGIGVKFNASLAVSGVLLEAQGLRMIARLTEPFTPLFDIDGLAASYASPALAFGGGLVRIRKPEFLQFDGAVVVKAKKFGISAFASYATSTPPSMFIFALLNVPVGGPPAFFVNGFSGGFGFNRSLVLPKLEDVPRYPLVAGASISTNPFGEDPTLGDFVRVMDEKQLMPVAPGEYWAAAGVAVETYGSLQSQLLLTVAFGTRFQIGIIGLSTLSIPPKVETPAARAELAMEAVFLPDDGLLAVSAQLTPSSYVFSEECTLSGGFAFWLWFSPSEFSGDFVVTLGGYNPYYVPPPHYPDVPRLGLNWNMSEFPLVLKGAAYIALTPHAVMAGGTMSATWTVPAITAWFNINADFLIQWKPFHYAIRSGVTFGVRATVEIGVARITLSVTLGADLQLWGPPFSGKATLNLGVISLTIAFGEPESAAPAPIGWSEFKRSFLPRNDSVVRTLFAEGLQQDLRGQGASVDYTVDPQRLELYVQTVFPAKTVAVNGTTLATRNQRFGINPMSIDAERLTADLTIVLRRDGESYDSVDVAVNAGPAPKAMWLRDAAPAHTINNDALIADVAQGLTIVPAADDPAHSLPIDIDTLLYARQGTDPASWGADVAPKTNPYKGLDPTATLTETIDSAAVSEARVELISNLLYAGFLVTPDTNLAPLANPDTLGLLDPPVLSPLGEDDAAA